VTPEHPADSSKEDIMTDKRSGSTPPEGPGTEYVERIEEYVDNSRQRRVLAVLLALLVLLLIASGYFVARLTRPQGTPTQASLPEGMTWVRSIYGWGNGRNQQLAGPTDVSIAADGTIWALSEHHVIVAFNPDGTMKRAIQPKIGASFEGISVADTGNIFVADFGGGITEFKPDGTVVTTWKVELPNEVDVRNGKIAVAAANGVAVFTPDDKILAQFGTRGQGPDQFDLPHGILQGADGTLYVSDTHNRRVEAFDPTGRLLWTSGAGPRPASADWRSADASASLFELPAGLTMDGAGRLVVIDPFKFQIIVLDAKTGKLAKVGTKKAVYGDFGQADGLFNYPTGIAYDKTRDWFVIADTANNRLQIVRIPGSGGSPVAALAAAYSPPVLVCLIPLALLLVALALVAMRRRRERLAATSAEAPPNE